MDIPQQRQIADSMLAKLEAIDPHAMLAGGAPRDWSFGDTATDLDFYIYAESIRDVGQKLYNLYIITEAQLLSLEIFVEDGNYNSNKTIKWLFNAEYDGQKIQIMVMSRPVAESVLQHFSLSICKIWYKNQTTYTTPEFLKTIEEKVIKQVQEVFGSGYISKILAKFPDYDFIPLTYNDDRPIPF